jgi:dienelactone hydrolase
MASPTVALFTGGGWQAANPADMDPWVEDFHRHGIRAVSTTYPLHDVNAAVRYARWFVAQLPKPVVAYGISAGGTIAMDLAADGSVAGAVNVVGPTNLTTWGTPAGKYILGLMPALDRRAASPIYDLTPNASPMLLQCGTRDLWVPCGRNPKAKGSQSAAFVKRAKRFQSDVRLSRMTDVAHGQLRSGMRVARQWIERRWP